MRTLSCYTLIGLLLLSLSQQIIASPLRYILLTVQHSGSHFFRDLIINNTATGFFDEICYMNDHLSPFSCHEKLQLLLNLPGRRTGYPDDLQTTKTRLNSQLNSIDCTVRLGTSTKEMVDSIPPCVERLHSVGAIVHWNQGWMDPAAQQHLLNIVAASIRKGIKFALIFLHRTNYIAHSFAQANTARRNEAEASADKVDLAKTQANAALLSSTFSQTISRAASMNIPVYFVQYEDILNDDSVARRLIDSVGLRRKSSRFEVSTESKHHSNVTWSYIKNVNDIWKDLYLQRYSLLRLCMLFDDCPSVVPSFCSKDNVHCFSPSS